MPLIVEDNLPAKEILQNEDIYIMGKKRAITQDIRPIDIAILNLMPNKEETELHLLRSLSNTPLQVNIDLIKIESYESKNTEATYLEKFYKNFSEIKNKKYDGMIITGAPVELLNFEDVKYWDELSEIFEYARTNVYSTMFICWAAQAALYHYYNIPKHNSDKKIFGIYGYDIQEQNPLTRGFDDVFFSPQSRHTYTKEEDILKEKDLKIVCGRKDTGVSLVRSLDNRFIFSFGHSEYDTDILYEEYKRDISKGLPIEKPINYFRDNDEEKGIINSWRAHGSLLFSNWINHCVYPDTPYNKDEIKKKKVLKFGGSSLSDSTQFLKVKDIVESDENRSFVIVSAPGKRYGGDLKVTDILINAFRCNELDEKENLLKIIKGRYYNIVNDLNLDKSLLKVIDDTIESICQTKYLDYATSRGEYLSGIVLAEYLGYRFLDAKDLIFFNENGTLNKEKTYKSIKQTIKGNDKFVIPGFYGSDENGRIKTFERGGSDITGSLIASALNANMYENWTDVDGLMNKDPNLYEDAELIDNISFDEFLKISEEKDQVYHIDAIKPVMDENIPINIRNTNAPFVIGTIIKN